MFFFFDNYRFASFLITSIISLSISANPTITQGLQVEYYDGTNFDKFVTSRTESMIDMSWDRTPPVEGINPHECSIRWQGKLVPGRSGNYTFSARVDDGIRVWVDNQLIIDDWNLNDVGRFSGDIKLDADHEYELKVEYFNALHEGEITLLWKIPPKEKKWYHRWFDGDFEVISPEYFRRPIIDDPATQELPEKLVEHDEPDIVVSKKENVITTNKLVDKEQELKLDKVPDETNTSNVILSEKMVEDYIPRNIQFIHAQVDILEDSFQELNLFAEFMLDNPELTVKIEGHTDAVGNEELNKKLSERRAYAVASYLVKKGVKAKRISAEGFGGMRPIVKPKEGSYHPANRRVEFLVEGL